MERKRLGLLAIFALGGFMLFGLIGKADELAPCAKLPSVTANDQDGRAVDLAAAGGKGWTLVYFYPKADTPSLWEEFGRLMLLINLWRKVSRIMSLCVGP